MTPGRRAFGVLVLLAGLCGCGLQYWNKPGATLDDINRDSSACAKEASPQYGILIDDVYRACLRGRGWVRAPQHAPPPAGWYRGIE